MNVYLPNLNEAKLEVELERVFNMNNFYLTNNVDDEKGVVEVRKVRNWLVLMFNDTMDDRMNLAWNKYIISYYISLKSDNIITSVWLSNLENEISGCWIATNVVISDLIKKMRPDNLLDRFSAVDNDQLVSSAFTHFDSTRNDSLFYISKS